MQQKNLLLSKNIEVFTERDQTHHQRLSKKVKAHYVWSSRLNYSSVNFNYLLVIFMVNVCGTYVYTCTLTPVVKHFMGKIFVGKNN